MTTRRRVEIRVVLLRTWGSLTERREGWEEAQSQYGSVQKQGHQMYHFGTHRTALAGNEGGCSRLTARCSLSEAGLRAWILTKEPLRKHALQFSEQYIFLKVEKSDAQGGRLAKLYRAR